MIRRWMHLRNDKHTATATLTIIRYCCNIASLGSIASYIGDIKLYAAFDHVSSEESLLPGGNVDVDAHLAIQRREGHMD